MSKKRRGTPWVPTEVKTQINLLIHRGVRFGNEFKVLYPYQKYTIFLMKFSLQGYYKIRVCGNAVV